MAVPAPGVLDAIAHADAVVICPSNPVVSIGPILALEGVREAVARETRRRDLTDRRRDARSPAWRTG